MLSRKEYVDANGTICPYCKSKEISGDEFDFDGMCREVTCFDCGETWNDIYKLYTFEYFVAKEAK